jgi:hypothetical protein
MCKHLKSLKSDLRPIELEGKQDDFCLICGDHEAELFPQLGPKEIHLCPRQFCKKCYYIEASWKNNSCQFNDEIYRECEFVPLCCTLCWKRGWDISSPLLGQEQPEWQRHTKERMEDVLGRRYKHWEECAVDKECEGWFKWRLPLRYVPDDMTLESDRKLLKVMKNGFLKTPARFNKFAKTAMLESPRPSGAVFDVRVAFDDITRRLLNLIPPDVMDHEVEEDGEAEEEGEGAKGGAEDLEEIGEEGDHEATEQVRQSPPQTAAGRPQRQAAQFSFVKVKGVPVRQSRSTPQKVATSNSPGSAQEMLDRQISSSMVAGSSTPDTSRSLHTRAPTQDVSRRRGRPRKSLTAPTSLPPLPSTQEDDATRGPSLVHDEMADDADDVDDSDNADSEQDESFDQIKAIIENKQNENRRLREIKIQQRAQLRLVNEELQRSRATAEKLVHERKTFSTTETNLRDTLFAAKAEKETLQRNVAESNELHERQLQTITELNERISQQGEQATDVQRLRQEIMDHERKHASLEADLEASRAKEAEFNNEIADHREAYDELQDAFEKLKGKNANLEKENRDFFQSIARRQQEIEDLKKATGTMDRKSKAIRTLRDGQDDVMEENKQLRKDIANLGAELVIDRGLNVKDCARLQHELACGSLTAELVDRLVQNPFLEAQMTEKIKERDSMGRGSGDMQVSEMGRAKRRRTGRLVDFMDPTCRREDSEMYN